eukprot:3617444-Pyramimonas_sp.AAC.1
MRVYRAAARVRFQEAQSQVSDALVLARLRKPTPAMLLRAARLRLFGSLLNAGPTLAFVLVAAEWHDATDRQHVQGHTTLGQFIEDMTWLHRALLPCASLPAPADDLAAR